MGAKKIKPPPKTSAKAISAKETQIERLTIWAEKKKMMIIVVAAAIFFPILSNWGMGAYREHNENKARTDYTAIASRLPSNEKSSTSEEWHKLIPELQKFSSNHKGTQSALIAQIELAKAYYETTLYDEAIKTGLDALKAVPPGEGLKPLVQYQLAFAYEASGKLDQALKEWTSLKESGIVGLDREADWRIGKIHAAGKDYAKAVEMYSKALEAPGSYPPQPLMEQELALARQRAGSGEKQEK